MGPPWCLSTPNSSVEQQSLPGALIWFVVINSSELALIHHLRFIINVVDSIHCHHRLRFIINVVDSIHCHRRLRFVVIIIIVMYPPGIDVSSLC